MCNVHEISKINQHLGIALEAAKMVIWDWDLLTNCIVWSSSDQELFGFAAGTFPETYESAVARIYPKDLEAVTLVLNQARIERHDYHQELRILGSNGSIHWVEAKGKFFYNNEGQAVRMLGTLVEMSDCAERTPYGDARKAREEQLRLLESVIVHTKDALLITEAEPLDPPGSRIVYVNPAFTQMTGYTLEEVLGKTPRILQGEKTERVALEKIRTAMQNWQPVQVDLINYTKDGKEFWVEISLVPVKDETGWYTHWVAVQRDITERKQTEAALKQSEERFRQLAENIQDVFWISDPINGQILYISPAYETIWGRKCESLYANSMDWMNSIHPDDRERVQANLYERAHQGQQFEHEYRIVRPDGNVRWIRDRGFPLKDEIGQVQRITGIAQDITERKHTEVALQQLNEELENRVKQRTLELEASQVILQQQVERERLMKRLTQQIRQSLDLKTILNTVVTEVQKLLAADRVVVYQVQLDGTGITVAEAMMGEWTSILDQVFPEETFPQQSHQQYLKGRIYTLTDRDQGKIVPCLAEFLAEIQVRAKLVVPIIQQDSLWGLLIVHQCSQPREWQSWEVSLLKQLTSQMAIAIQQSELYQQLKEELWEHQRTEVALRRSETLFRSLSEFAPVGIFLCDSQGRNIYTNPRCQAIYGCTFEESLGYGWLKLVHPEDLQVVPQWFTLLGAHQEVKGELRFIQNDGTIRYCRVKSVPIFSESGEQVTHVGIAEDITESLAIEKMKNEFISVVSHELRTPLAAIHGSLGLLAAGVLKDQPDTAQQMLEIAASDTERLVRLVNDILDLERLKANKVTLVKQWCDAAQLMRQTVKTVQSLAAESNIKLFILPTSVQVWADPDRIIQTLVNLVSNAIKFSPPQTTVTLSAAALSDHVLFKVQDQGRGIPYDKLETIFGKFQQVDASDSRQKGGTGLGLPICRSIVEQHGGKIWAESVLGKGSVFYFTLPQQIDSEGYG
ncbi:PAS domain S-box protein [Mastigocladopsis repens]|uniref:PAS domain S-box protein n=1 Tax=Mastigocladopsis repens TaxID=221287 RepID=UPI00037B976A|nr:PAS domain S-box protein [Mastigocladopsis repens]